MAEAWRRIAAGVNAHCVINIKKKKKRKRKAKSDGKIGEINC